MEFSEVLVAVAGWAALSIPVSLLIGGFIGRGSQTPQEIPVHVQASSRAA